MKPDAKPPVTEGAPARSSAPLDDVWQEKLRAPRAARLIPRLSDRQALPLSFAQERLWLLDQLEPANPVYCRPVALRLKGLLDESTLRATLQVIVDRHEVLRTRFMTCEGRPERIVSAQLPLPLRVIDLSGREPGERESEARRLATEESIRPFDLARDPVLRATLLRLGDEEHVLLLVFHHIVFDGWSAQVLVSEFTTFYQALRTGSPPVLPELPIQYADFAHWQRQRMSGALLERELTYWKQQLHGCVSVDLPTDHPRPSIQSSRGGCVGIFLSESLTDSLRTLSRRENATIFMVLLAAFQTLLARYTESEDIVVGSPVAGRNRVETEKLIGIFINLLVLRTDLSGNPTFRELLGRVREVCRGAYRHQDLPFEKLVETLRPERDLSTTPLFQVMFNLENLPGESAEIPGLRVEESEFEFPVAPYDLTVEIIPGGRRLKCSFSYRADLFDRATVERMAGHFRALLESIVADPDGRIATLPLLSSAERRQLLVEWNDTRKDYPSLCLHQLFEAQAERTPEAVALISDSHHVKYRELNYAANRIAHALRSMGVGPETFVGVCLERALDAVIALLGILKAGAAFVPLDPAYPGERLAFMIADARLPVVLSRRKWLPIVRQTGARIVCLDVDRELIEAQSHANPPCEVGPANVAYLLYTSGSTGTPKGVLGLHRGAVNRCAWMWRSFPFARGEVGCHTTSLNFVDCIWEMFGPLLQGIPNVIVSDQTMRDPAELIEALAAHRVTRIVLVPSLLRMILESYPDLGRRLPELKWWTSSGEALAPDLARRFASALPTAQLLNLYGSTEVAADATAYLVGPVSKEQRSVPLGRPLDNTRLYVLDRRLQPVPIGVPGELYVGGDLLARGYWNRPELTAERFIADPFSSEPDARLYRMGDRVSYLPNGCLQFLGRNDDQVKLRGFRIELGEIETTLAQHPAVAAAAVVAREEAPGDKRLVAYVVLRRGATSPSAKGWRDFLKRKLPDYMLPADFVTTDTLPLSPNGKVDRRALAARGRPRQKEIRYVAARDVVEGQLTRIWEDILGLHPIGIDQDFFDLGGHSLLAVRMMDHVERAFCQRLPLTTLFQGATIQHLADCLRTVGRQEAQSVIIPVQPHGSLPPFFFLHGDWTGGLYCRKLARLLGGDQPFYALAPSGFGETPLLSTVEAMAADNIRHLVATQPAGPYLLGGFCSGGLVAYEMARQLREQGSEVGPVILVDIAVPRYFDWLKTFVRGSARLARLDADGEGQLYMQLRGYLLRTQSAYHRGPAALLTLWYETARRKVLRLAGTPPEQLGIPPPPIDDAEQLLRFQRFVRTLMNYRPKPYDGRVVLLRTKSLLAAYPTDRMAGWGKLAAQLEIHELPGDHTTCQTEHVDLVAEHIQSCLSTFRAEKQGGAAYNQPQRVTTNES